MRRRDPRAEGQVRFRYNTYKSAHGYRLIQRCDGRGPFLISGNGIAKRLATRDMGEAIGKFLNLIRKAGSINGKYTYPKNWESVAKLITSRRRHRAREKGLEFSLTPEFIYKMMESNNFCCAISGIPFRMPRRDDPKTNAVEIEPWAPSIDRIDISQGYVPNNVRVVSVAANYALNRFGSDVLAELARGIVRVRDGVCDAAVTEKNHEQAEMLKTSRKLPFLRGRFT